MRTTILTALGAVLLSTPVSVRPTAAASRITVKSLEYIDVYGPTEKVKVWRGVNADITIGGTFLDLATGVEVRTSAGNPTSDVTATITSRFGGVNTRIILRVTPKVTAQLDTYKVLIHYAVEASGPDQFSIRVFEHGIVDQVRILEAPEPNGAYRAGKTYTVRINGSRLAGSALNPAVTQATGLVLLAAPQTFVGSVTSEANFSVRFDTPGLKQISARDFYDASLPRPTSCNAWCYDGQGVLGFRVAVQPTVTSLSTNSPAANTSVTLSGSNLVVPGFSPTISLLPRYGNLDPSTPASVIGTDLRFTIPANVRRDSIQLRYIPDQAQNSQTILDPIVDLPQIAVQGGAPVAFLLDSLPATSGLPRKLLMAGSRTMRGKFLAPNIALTQTLSLSPGTITRTPVPSPTTLQPPSTPSSPTITFGGTPLTVTSARYDRNTFQPGGERGSDVITFTVPAFADTVTRDLVVTTPSGSTTLSNVTFLPPPFVDNLFRRVGNGQPIRVPDLRLFKGVQYELAGIGLIVQAQPGSPILEQARARLNGIDITQGVSGVTPQRVVIAVPSTATSGPLIVETRAGTVNIGTFTVENPPTAPAIAGVSLSPIDVVGGKPTTATVAFNAAIPAGSSAGTIIVSLSQPDAAVVIPGPVTITGNPTTFSINTQVVNSVHAVPIRVASDAGGGTATLQTATLRIHPPAPTALTFDFPTAIVGGHPITGTVQLNGTAPPGFTVALASSDPSTGPVPATAAASGTTATFTFTPPVVGSTRTVTITATSDGQTVSAPLTVLPPSVASLSVPSTTVIGPAQVPVTFGLTAPATAGQTATVHCFSPTAAPAFTCPSSVPLSGTSGSFTATLDAVPSARDVNIEVTAGTQTSRVTISLQPLALQSATVSPANVAAGAASSVTLQLNRAAVASDALTLQLTSSDPTVASVPASVTFPPGQQTRLISITTHAPLAQQKTVTITATGTATTPSGPTSLSATATIVVRP